MRGFGWSEVVFCQHRAGVMVVYTRYEGNMLYDGMLAR